jgi:RimJ/RimL family protein N-acetyltransferase
MSHRGELGISVRKSHWNQGVGTALMEHILDFAKNVARSEILSLEVRSDQKNAIRLYSKFGFQKIGTFKGFFKINGRLVDFDLMELIL